MFKILLLVALCFVASVENSTPKEEALIKFMKRVDENVPSRKELLKLNFTDFKEKDAQNNTVSFKRYQGKCVFVGFYGPDLDAYVSGDLSSLAQMASKNQHGPEWDYALFPITDNNEKDIKWSGSSDLKGKVFHPIPVDQLGGYKLHRFLSVKSKGNAIGTYSGRYARYVVKKDGEVSSIDDTDNILGVFNC